MIAGDPARQAYLNNDIELSKKAHGVMTDPQEAVTLKANLKPHNEKHKGGGEYIKSAVYGGMDGIITTYSVVMGSLGADLSIGVVLALGVANLISDGLSMALGDYISSKSEREYYQKEMQREKWEVENNPEGEKLEMVDLYKEKGFEQEDAIIISETLAKNKDAWINVMMSEELGLSAGDENPLGNALVTFFSFAIFGLMPILPFIVGVISGLEEGLFYVSTIMTGVFLFILGVAKSMFSYASWYVSGLETLIIGAIAAAVAFLIGLAFEGVAT